jgi:hypothetical protein
MHSCRTTACGSAAGRRAPTIHRRRPAAKPQCQREALTAAGSAVRALQNADGQLQPIVRQRHEGMRIRSPEACDRRNSYPFHPAPALAERAATRRRRATEAPGLKATMLLSTNDANRTRTQSGPETDARRTTSAALQRNHFWLRRRGLKARAAMRPLETTNAVQPERRAPSGNPLRPPTP